MAIGIDVFREHFRNYSDQYVLIGGVACELLLDEAGAGFRPTRDIDMVLVVEAITTDFVRAFWQFIDDGDYNARQKSSGKPEFYRFVDPKSEGYPSMIELFARPGNNVDLSYPSHLIPLHIDDELSSLSAILLNESYYTFLLDGRTMSGGISVLDGPHLVPMKMKAWLDLTEKKEKGEHVNDRDLRKHRQDVFRLFPLISDDEIVYTPPEVYEDVHRFIEALRVLPFDTSQIGVNVSKDAILDVYNEIYLIRQG